MHTFGKEELLNMRGLAALANVVNQVGKAQPRFTENTQVLQWNACLCRQPRLAG